MTVGNEIKYPMKVGKVHGRTEVFKMIEGEPHFPEFGKKNKIKKKTMQASRRCYVCLVSCDIQFTHVSRCLIYIVQT